MGELGIVSLSPAMALLKSRPKLKLYLPHDIHPGESFVSNLVIAAKRAVPVTSVDVDFVGIEHASIGSGQYATHARESLVSQRARLMDKREIQPGESTHRIRFELPAGAPPSHQGRATSISYTLKVRVDIPWWPDRKQEFVVPVTLRPAASDRAPTPAVYSSAVDGPIGTEPHAEVSLADSAIESGGVLVGAVALGNVEYARYAGVDVSLLVYEVSLIQSRRQEVEMARYSLHLDAEHAVEGKALGFRMRLPSIVPSFSSRIVKVRHVLEVRGRRRFARDLVLQIPLEVSPARDKAKPSDGSATPPVVGADRLERVWKSLAEPRGFELVGEELVASLGEVNATIRREHRGGKGVYVVAELRYPSLGLGLVGGRTGAIKRLLGSVKPAPWDSGLGLSARDTEQLEAFASALAPALSGSKVETIDDDKLRLEMRGAGLAVKSMERFFDSVLSIARALPVARADIPAPKGFDVAGWTALAASISGSLELSRMAVRGEISGCRLEIVTEWTGIRPLETRITVHLRARIPPRSIGELRPDGLGRLGVEARPIAERLFTRAETLLIDRDSMTALLPAPLASPETTIDWLVDSDHPRRRARRRSRCLPLIAEQLAVHVVEDFLGLVFLETEGAGQGFDRGGFSVGNVIVHEGDSGGQTKRERSRVR